MHPDAPQEEKDLIPKSMMADMLEIFMRPVPIDDGSIGEDRWENHVKNPSMDFFVMERA